MAVRHGYGKIAGTDALVFAYDTGDTRNSYKGEPTTNIIADPLYALGTKNAYHDTNNTGWGTVTRGRIEEVIGPFGKPVQAYSQELISHTSGNRSIEGQPQEVVNNANSLFNLAVGTTYRISVWIKATYTSTSQNRLYLSGAAAVGDGTNRQVTTEWQRFSKTFSPSTTGTYYMRHYDYSSKQTGAKIWYALPQVEIDRGHNTQFTTGTRSSTQGLVDLTGNSTIDLSNVSFDSNAQLFFDGTDDLAPITGLTISATQNKSYEAVIKLAAGYNLPGTIIGGARSTTNAFQIVGDRRVRGLEDDEFLTGVTILDTEKWYHVVYTFEFDGTSAYQKVYVNGILDNQRTIGTYIDGYVASAQYLGYDSRFSERFNGNIDICKVYNRALTAAEVRNNYNQYKTRFDI